MASDQPEIQNADREPDRNPDDALPVDRVGELETDGHQRDDDRQIGAELAERAAIGTIDMRVCRRSRMNDTPCAI